MQIIISVIIPTLNESVALPSLLNDLQNQTEKNFEVIIVDGKSDDDTRKQAYKYNNTLHLHFFEFSKRNVSLQRNFGASKANGEYLFFLDADSRIKSDAIRNAIKHIVHEKDLLYLPKIESSNPSMRYRLLVNFSTLSVRLLQKIGKPLSTGPIILVKRDFFNTLDGYDSSVVISEDHNLIVKAYKRGVKAHFLSDVECLFSMRRFEKEGIWNVVRKYAYFIVITLIKGGVYNKSKSFSYETGGHNFSKATEQSKHNHNTKN